MNTLPILFSAPMVRAILDGCKTQTRRPIKTTRRNATELFVVDDAHPFNGFEESLCDENGMEHPIPCPYGQPGDRLWVRETWRTLKSLNPVSPRNLAAGAPIQYEAGGTNLNISGADRLTDAGKLRPSIFLPRWASRVTLEATDVRVQRFQDISEQDAESEGIQFMRDIPDADETLTARQLFEILWDSINAKRGFGWDANPWVWAITFRRIDP